MQGHDIILAWMSHFQMLLTTRSLIFFCIGAKKTAEYAQNYETEKRHFLPQKPGAFLLFWDVRCENTIFTWEGSDFWPQFICT